MTARLTAPPDVSTVPPLGDALDFMRLIWALDHSLQSTSKRMESSLGVTGPQRLVLRMVGRFPGISAGQLAGLLLLHPSTLTGIIQRLEKRGLLGRRTDTGDRRRALLALTSKGRALDVEAPGTVEAAVQRALRSLPASTWKATRQALMALAAELEPKDDVNKATKRPRLKRAAAAR